MVQFSLNETNSFSEKLPMLLAALLILSLLTAALVTVAKQFARYLAIFLVSLHSFTIVLVFFNELSLLSVSVGLVLCASLINQARIAVYRLQPIELRSRSVRTAVIVPLLLAGLVALHWLSASWHLLGSALWVSFCLSVLLFLSFVVTIFRYRYRRYDTTILTKLPTVSVCIPARNETQDLPECIESVLSSNYPKLEVLVLDDCSHDKTPEVIKEYAHRGVRFLSGQEPKDGWLAKNKAMDKLFAESTGEIVIFAGVDVRFAEQSIQFIAASLQNGIRMVSVLPRRTLARERSVFIQPLRYWWELAIPRFVTKRPPVLSTLWAIYRKDLQAAGGFASCKSSVQPEAHFAKRLRQAYGFVISAKRFGLTSVKSPREQFDTAVRTRYPQLKRRPETVVALLLVEAVVFLSPLIGLLAVIASGSSDYLVLSLVTILLQLGINVAISYLTVRRSWLIGLVSLPFLLVEEWLVVVRSMLAYEFGSVVWKERNICLPMLKVEKSLPKLD